MQTVQSIEIPCTPERAFAAACGLDPRDIFRPSGALPGVSAISGRTAPWSAVGERRRVTLTDGSTLSETLSHFESGRAFVYRISEFSGLLGALVRGGEGGWLVETAGAASRLSWRYRLEPRSLLTAPAVAVIVGLFMPAYMRAALRRVSASIVRGEAS